MCEKYSRFRTGKKALQFPMKKRAKTTQKTPRNVGRKKCDHFERRRGARIAPLRGRWKRKVLEGSSILKHYKQSDLKTSTKHYRNCHSPIQIARNRWQKRILCYTVVRIHKNSDFRSGTGHPQGPQEMHKALQKQWSGEGVRKGGPRALQNQCPGDPPKTRICQNAQGRRETS